jgi:hypothetical protein
MSNGGDIADANSRSNGLFWKWLVPLVLGGVLVSLLVEVHGLRGDVHDLQGQVEGSSPGASGPDLAEFSEMCGLLGALAKANGVKPADLFRANAVQSDCEAAAVDASTR